MTHTSDALLFCDNSFSVICVTVLVILYLKFWAFFYCRRRCVFAWSSIQKRNPPANVQLLLTTSCRSRCQLSVFTHTYTSYLPSCLHSRNLRPRNCTLESVKIRVKSCLATKLYVKTRPSILCVTDQREII